MFAGTANGESLPPYVLYKAEHVGVAMGPRTHDKIEPSLVGSIWPHLMNGFQH